MLLSTPMSQEVETLRSRLAHHSEEQSGPTFQPDIIHHRHSTTVEGRPFNVTSSSESQELSISLTFLSFF